MKSTLLILVAILFLVACKNEEAKPVTSDGITIPHTIIEEGIYVEKFDSNFTDENRYNLDNKIFTVDRKFVYDYTYYDKQGGAFYFEGGRDGWNFVSTETDRYYVVKSIEITVLPGLEPMINSIPGYNLTQLEFVCPPNTDHTISGVLENSKNIWMQPPREALFRVLELNPFPFIQAPYEVGHSWEWELDIDNEWGDPRWVTWEGSVKSTYTYKITDKKQVKTPLGDLECFLIEGVGTSALGQTSLLSVFNEEYGFVKLNYTNIDGSTIVMNLNSAETTPGLES